MLDRGVIELVGPNGLTNVFNNTGSEISKLDTGHITTYALYITIGFLFLLTVLFSSFIFNDSINEFIKITVILIYSLFINYSANQNNKSA